jgi:hypothetical protein
MPYSSPSSPFVFQTLLQTLPSENLFPLLAKYHILPQLIFESIIDRAIATVHCTDEEIATVSQDYYQQWQLVTAEQQQWWRSHCGLSSVQFAELVTRSLRLQKFQQATWGHQIESYFLQRKHELDRVIYSMLRTQDQDLAQELFFRLVEGEQSFAELSPYSEGIEADTGGLIGPVELGTLNRQLAEQLYSLQVGQVEPLKMGDWCLIIRLEKWVPAQLDEVTRQRLLQEKMDDWIQAQLQQLPALDQVWLGMGGGATEGLAIAP